MEKQNQDNEVIVSKFRILISQVIATVAVNLMKLTFGTCLGFTSILISELYNDNAEISITENELTWYSSQCFMVPIGSLAGGFLAGKIGHRLLILIAGIAFVTSFLITYWAKISQLILCAQAIIGLAGGLSKGTTFAYLAEILQPRFRSTLMATNNLFYLLGIFFSTFLGAYVHWRTVILVNIIFPVISFLMMLFIPNSPHWLASKNRYDEAELSLIWFRGWSNSKLVKDEYMLLRNSLSDTHSSGEIDRIDININNNKKKTRLRETIKPFFNKSFYYPLLIIIFMVIIHAFSGIHLMVIYSGRVFQEMKSPIEKQTAIVILNVVRFVGAIFCSLTIHFLGKRKLSFLSLFGGGSIFILAAIFEFLITHDYIDSPIYLWIPTISVFAAIFAISSFEKITFILTGIIFPCKQRSIGTGISHFVNDIVTAIVTKVFLDIVYAITVPGTFIFFGIINIFGLLTIYFVLPETDGKTLQEIEDCFSGVQKLKRQKDCEN